jgi:hypothetical protein
MNNLAIRKLFFTLIVIILAVSSGQAQGSRGSARNNEKGLFGKTLNTKQKKVREPRSVVRAKKKQEANENKLNKEYNDYVKESRKRAVKIQSPEVQERMAQNRKDANQRYKVKRKKAAESGRKTGKKYR